MKPANMAQLRDLGYTILRGVYPAPLVVGALTDVDAQVTQLANALVRHGRLSPEGMFCEESVHRRLALLDGASPRASVILHKHAFLSHNIRKLFANEHMLDIVEQILGTSNISGCPQWHLRCKTPEAGNHNNATVPWHQEEAYLTPGTARNYCLKACIPLGNTNNDAGPIQILPGPWFRKQRLLAHEGCYTTTWYVQIQNGEMEKYVANLESETVTLDNLSVGDVILIDHMTPHRSLPNLSKIVSWSVDLRWCRTGEEPGGMSGRCVPMRAEGSRMAPDDVAWHSAGFTKNPPWDDAEAVTPMCGGAWMDRWPLVNVNEHVLAYRAKK